MTQKEIIQNNILIAGFMEIDLTDSHRLSLDENLNTVYNYALKYENNFNDEYFEGELCFNKSWDWLIPVVEKISNLKHTITGDYFRVSINFFEGIHIFCHTSRKEIIDIVQIKSSQEIIDSVYEGVVEFVKWYNKQNNGKGS